MIEPEETKDSSTTHIDVVDKAVVGDDAFLLVMQLGAIFTW
jgi:hypothetical protein